MTAMLPNTNGRDTPEQRDDKAVSTYNIAASRYNSALEALKWAQREYDDAERWLDEASDDLNHAASVTGLPGAP